MGERLGAFGVLDLEKEGLVFGRDGGGVIGGGIGVYQFGA